MRLRLERLENRNMLAVAALVDDSGLTLAEYLAQEPVMGPVVPLDIAATDQALAELAEGEDPPPCEDDPETPEDECAPPEDPPPEDPPICTDDPETEEDECNPEDPPPEDPPPEDPPVCLDDPETPEDECDVTPPPPPPPPPVNPDPDPEIQAGIVAAGAAANDAMADLSGSNGGDNWLAKSEQLQALYLSVRERQLAWVTENVNNTTTQYADDSQTIGALLTAADVSKSFVTGGVTNASEALDSAQSYLLSASGTNNYGLHTQAQHTLDLANLNIDAARDNMLGLGDAYNDAYQNLASILTFLVAAGF